MGRAIRMEARVVTSADLASRALDGLWKARNATGIRVDQLRAKGAPEDVIATAMAEYLKSRAAEDAALTVAGSEIDRRGMK